MRQILLNKQKYFQNNFSLARKMENKNPVYNLLMLDRILRESYAPEIKWAKQRSPQTNKQ